MDGLDRGRCDLVNQIAENRAVLQPLLIGLVTLFVPCHNLNPRGRVRFQVRRDRDRPALALSSVITCHHYFSKIANFKEEKVVRFGSM